MIVPPTPGHGKATGLGRFLPVVEQSHRAPGEAPTLHRAALLCHLAPAYFSRRFAQVFAAALPTTSPRTACTSRRAEPRRRPRPLSQIGYTHGFAWYSYFTVRFGMTLCDRRQMARLQNRPNPIIAA